MLIGFFVFKKSSDIIPMEINCIETINNKIPKKSSGLLPIAPRLNPNILLSIHTINKYKSINDPTIPVPRPNPPNKCPGLLKKVVVAVTVIKSIKPL